METIGDIMQTLAVFGGITMVIWASAKAKLEHRKLDMMGGRGQVPSQSAQEGSQFPLVAGGKRDDAVLAELRGLKQQIGEMQNTSHQFDLAFDAALERMEQRVAHLETKSISVSVSPTDTPTVLRNGQG